MQAQLVLAQENMIGISQIWKSTAVVRTKTMWHQMVLAWQSRKYKIWKVANFCGNECPQKKN
jgi:hypothetical protein